MNSYWQAFIDSMIGHSRYIWKEISHPALENYFYFLIIVSLVVWGLELIAPWRKNQPIFRKQFWMDAFYMFFNFFIFIIFFIAFANTLKLIFENLLGRFGSSTSNLQILYLGNFPVWVQLILFAIMTDFVQWMTHRLLHRVDFLWQFHKVHHSVEQMGFAAHLRYHWMETVVYKSILYFPLLILTGVDTAMIFVVYYFNILIGHLNHANIKLTYGPLKYILNNPYMHIWHHAKELPYKRRYGVNFGITLSLWDYLSGTAYIPESGKDIPLGFDHIESFPQRFWGHMVYPFRKHK